MTCHVKNVYSIESSETTCVWNSVKKIDLYKFLIYAIYSCRKMLTSAVEFLLFVYKMYYGTILTITLSRQTERTRKQTNNEQTQVYRSPARPVLNKKDTLKKMKNVYVTTWCGCNPYGIYLSSPPNKTTDRIDKSVTSQRERSPPPPNVENNRGMRRGQEGPSNPKIEVRVQCSQEKAACPRVGVVSSVR